MNRRDLAQVQVVRANDLGELRTAMEANPPNIPRLVTRRRNRDREHWIADRIVYALAASGQLDFPIERALRDKPDCRLAAGPREIGLEISELVPWALRRAQELRETDYPDAEIHASDFPWTRDWTEDEIIDYLKRKGKHARGYGGEREEREWAEAANASTIRKTAKLNAADFERFPENWLGLYASFPPPALMAEALAAALVDPRQVNPKARTFDRLLLLAQGHLILTPHAIIAAPELRFGPLPNR